MLLKCETHDVIFNLFQCVWTNFLAYLLVPVYVSFTQTDLLSLTCLLLQPWLNIQVFLWTHWSKNKHACPMRLHEKFGSKVVQWQLGMQMVMTNDFRMQSGTKKQKRPLYRLAPLERHRNKRDLMYETGASICFVTPLSCAIRKNQLQFNASHTRVVWVMKEEYH